MNALATALRRRSWLLLNARKRRAARIAYSARWAHLRMRSWIVAIAASEISGANHRRNGTRNRDVCSADVKSVEPTKIKIIQSRTESQDLRNECILKVRNS